MQDYEVKHANLKNVRLAYIDEGVGPVILCLHGFPDSADMWWKSIEIWNEAGYRVIAPFVRGFAPSGAARCGRYGAHHIGYDAISLMETLGIKKCHIVGIDWGAVGTNMAIVHCPDKFYSATMVAVPPMKALYDGTWVHHAFVVLSQIDRFFYMLPLAIPFIGPAFARRKHGRFFRKMRKRWSPTWDIPDEIFRMQNRALRGHHLSEVLKIYRHSSLPFKDKDFKELIHKNIQVPSLFIRGEHDGLIYENFFRHVEDYCEGDCEYVPMGRVGHFAAFEDPEKFSKIALEHIKKYEEK